jgi:UDP-2,3-diacylglucosamine pyrophosphatase LpxH
MEPTTHYRTIWISDLHLGTPEAKANFLLDFLSRHEADRYYLVGDVFDGWALQRSWYWPTSHNEVIQGLLRKAQSTNITYVPGNHDEVARDYPGLQLGGITIKKNAVHTTADGRDFLVVHGDEFEGVVRHAKWLDFLGGWAYVGVLKLDRWFNKVRRLFNLPYWSLSTYLKHSTRRAVQFISDFEETAAHEAGDEGHDGVICGHIHHPSMRHVDGVHYANTGDWVESCTALVEHLDGRLELLRWLPDAEGSREAIASEAPVPRDGRSDSAVRDAAEVAST